MPSIARQQWSRDVVRLLQEGIGAVSTCDPEETPGILRQLAASLPTPTGPAEELFLYGAILQYAARTGTSLHAAHGQPPGLRCRAFEGQLLAQLCATRPERIRQAFQVWTRNFAAHLSEVHQPTIATRTPLLLAAHFETPVNLGTVSKQYGVSPTTLQRAFISSYGMSAREYRERLRIARSLDEIPYAKVEAIARSLGYRSPKNFYRAFSKATGTTPAKWREMPAREREAIRSTVLANLPSPDRRLASDRRVRVRRRTD